MPVNIPRGVDWRWLQKRIKPPPQFGQFLRHIIMHTMLTCIFYTLLLLMLLAIVVYIKFSSTDISATTLEGIQALLDPIGEDEQTKLRARAHANLRLIPAFDLGNTFVSDDPNVHHAFVNETKCLLKHWSRDWNKFGEVANLVVAKYLKLLHSNPEESSDLPFDSFVQAVTLATILITFFETDPNILEFEDVVSVARGITQRWKESKVGTLSREGLDDLNGYLHQWVPTGIYPKPLDYIIPSFETMWRVVATTMANEYRHSESRLLCDQFLQNPARTVFEQSYCEQGYTVNAMINESLRLYPPTRHISRSIPISPPKFRRAFEALGICLKKRGVADIETFQRSTAWGPNPNVYDPRRHSSKEVLENQDATLLAFGIGSMQCIARKVAPHAAGILFAAIMVALPPSGSLVIDDGGGSIGGRDGWSTWKIKKLGKGELVCTGL